MSNILAKHAVHITQLLKTVEGTSQDVIIAILKEIPELTEAEIIDYLTGMANGIFEKLDLVFDDVNDLIDKLRIYAKSLETDLGWNNFWQSVAQGILYVAQLIKSVITPWVDVILAIIAAYKGLKEAIG